MSMKLSAQHNRGGKLFRLNPFWLKHHSFNLITQNSWNKFSNNLLRTINKFKKDLLIWNKESFGNINIEIKKIKKKLGGIQKALDLSIDY